MTWLKPRLPVGLWVLIVGTWWILLRGAWDLRGLIASKQAASDGPVGEELLATL